MDDLVRGFESGSEMCGWIGYVLVLSGKEHAGKQANATFVN